MTIDEVMIVINEFYEAQSDAHQFGGEANKTVLIDVEGKLKRFIEQYGKEEREKMRKECIEACVSQRMICDGEDDYSCPYNDAIADCTGAIEAIK